MNTSTECLTKACTELGIPFESLDANQSVIKVQVQEGPLFFHGNKTPFNSEAMSQICKDKDHTFQLLGKFIKMPQTVSFMDFNVQPKYHKYLELHSVEEILTEVDRCFYYPMVIKRNRGRKGNNVFFVSHPHPGG